MKCFALVMVAQAVCASAAETVVENAPLIPVGLKNVRLTEGFWYERQNVAVRSALPYSLEKFRNNFDDFAKAAGIKQGRMHGVPWDDSISYGLLNAAANSLVWHPDADLEKTLDLYIGWIAAAMEPDGYIYLARKLRPASELKGSWAYERWVNLRSSHEDFNSAHLLDAACAHYEATGRTNFLALARRNADLWCSVFRAGGRNDLTGHEAIKMALVRLYRDTGDRKYLDLAQYLLDHRADERPGELNKRFSAEYFQSHLPVREQREAKGHQVRAHYLYAAMADIYLETGDRALLTALEAIWADCAGRKLYLTGGTSPGGSEDFGPPYDLPNRSAYCETCAAIGSVFFNCRMNIATREAKYADAMERALLNNVLSGMALDGKGFFYENRLAMDKSGTATNGHERRGWPGCACCPPNILRLLTSVNAYFYATAPGSLYVNLYGTSEAQIRLDGQTVRVRQTTAYPRDGRVLMEVTPGKAGRLKLHLRIPAWAQSCPFEGQLYRYADAEAPQWKVSVNGQSAAPVFEKGYAVIDRLWQAGDRVELELPMPVRRVVSHPRVEADRDRVAFERGPLVYCAEGADNEGSPEHLVLDRPGPWTSEFRPDLLGGVTVLMGEARRVTDGDRGVSARVTLIPYYAWANRGPDDMAVWLPARVPSAAKSAGAGASPETCFDAPAPKNSCDHDVPRVTWWPSKGTAEWIERRFDAPVRLSASAVYWFDDTGRGHCRTPASWRLLYREGGQWKPVQAQDGYGVACDQYNRVTFVSVTTDALRMDVQLRENVSGGVLSWRVER